MVLNFQKILHRNIFNIFLFSFLFWKDYIVVIENLGNRIGGYRVLRTLAAFGGSRGFLFSLEDTIQNIQNNLLKIKIINWNIFLYNIFQQKTRNLGSRRRRRVSAGHDNPQVFLTIGFSIFGRYHTEVYYFVDIILLILFCWYYSVVFENQETNNWKNTIQKYILLFVIFTRLYCWYFFVVFENQETNNWKNTIQKYILLFVIFTRLYCWYFFVVFENLDTSNWKNTIQ